MQPNEKVRLSVVVIGRNEGARLSRCLASIRAMQEPGGGYELIYVDSASTDDSVARADDLGATVIRLCDKRPGAAAARNAGWRAANGEFVLFLDGDTILERDFAVAALAVAADSDVAVVWGHRRELFPTHSVYNRVLDLDWIYAPGVTEICGGDALIRRTALAQVGGYAEDLLAGEEPDLCRRLRQRGCAIVHIDKAMTRHDLAMTRWAQYWRRAVRAGHAYAAVADRSANSAAPLWGDVARANRRHALVLLVGLAATIAISVGVGSLWPIVAFALCVGALVLRSAYRARWRHGDPVTLLLYGIHSHLQQIPIFWGQLLYDRDCRRGVARGVIDYKGVA